MFCEKCGNKLPDGALFCGKCGAPVPVRNASQPAFAGQGRQQNVPPRFAAGQNQQQNVPPRQPQQTPEKAAATVGSALLSTLGQLLGGAIALGVVIAVAVFLIKDGGNFFLGPTDYIRTVQKATPSDWDVTYEELIDEYFEDAVWEEREGNDDVYYVDISGRLKNGDEDIVLTIRVEPVEDEPGKVWISPYRIKVEGQKFGKEAANEFLYQLYLNYEYGSDMANLYNLYRFFSLFS